MRLVILGGPGAGKGTQANWLSNHLQISLIATGDILRTAIANQTVLGQKAQAYVQTGELVPDEIMIEFIRYSLLLPDVESGWLLDGYPRTAFQAEELDFLLEDLQQRLDWAIYLKVDYSILKSRSLQRARTDDEPNIIQRRLQLFEERTIPILEYYSFRNRLLEINGNQTVKQVQQDILTALNSDA
ncbi:MAG: adenylate kinase [Microcoleaceae cyanobacterium]